MTTLQLQICFVTLIAIATMASASNNCKNILTFNAGLVASVPGAEHRRLRIIEALRNSAADFIFLQEVWFEKDVALIIEDLKSSFPHHYSKIHIRKNLLRHKDRHQSGCAGNSHLNPNPREVYETPCSTQDIMLLSEGFQQCGCSHLNGPSQQLCILHRCAHVLRNNTISPDCISCGTFESPRFHTIADALTACATSGDTHNRLNSPGLLVLSKERLRRVTYTNIFPSNRMMLEKGYIEAILKDGKRLVCAHFSSNFKFYLEYDQTFSSSIEQNREEMNIVGHAVADRDHVLVGDINAGKKVTGETDPEKNLEGDMTDNYDFFMRTFGYNESPYFVQDGRCTFCNSNPLTQGAASNVIDVVVVRHDSSMVVSSIGRVFDTDLSPSGPLSDHFGVLATVCDDN